MLRIASSHADVLGVDESDTAKAGSAERAPEGTLEEREWALLRTVYDPEIPANVVELGLIYDCSFGDTSEGLQDIAVKMTLTAPGCGMGPVLVEDVRRKLEELADVRRAQIELLFDPPWNPDMMSEAVRLQLGFM